jgi:hypothetical protein
VETELLIIAGYLSSPRFLVWFMLYLYFLYLFTYNNTTSSMSGDGTTHHCGVSEFSTVCRVVHALCLVRCGPLFVVSSVFY